MSDERACSEIDQLLGATLKRIRLEAELSQQNLADKLGISFQQVQKYESGANRISASRLYDIAKIFNVPVSDLFDGVDGAPPARSPPDVDDLMKSFRNIDDERVQQRIIDLVRSISAPGRR